MATKRPVVTGDLDALGRRVRVAATAVEGRASAPAPDAAADDGGFESMRDAMLDRRTLKGFRRDESAGLFDKLVAEHTGDNLVHALVYEGFAAERTAERFVRDLGAADTDADTDDGDDGGERECAACGNTFNLEEGGIDFDADAGGALCLSCTPDDPADMADGPDPAPDGYQPNAMCGNTFPPAVNEAGMVLERLGDSQPRKIGAGRWRVDTQQDTWNDPVNGLSRTRFSLGGADSGPASNRLKTAAAMMCDDGEMLATLRGLPAGTAVSILFTQANGRGDVEIVQGRIDNFDGEPGITFKQGGGKGFVLNGKMQVLSFRHGQHDNDAVNLMDQWRHTVARTPDLEPARFDDLPVWDGNGEPPRRIGAAYVLDGPDFGGGDVRGSVFFATDVQHDDEGRPEIVNGYHWFPDRSGLTSEHGSLYADDLRRRSGMVRGRNGWSPDLGALTFRDVMDTSDDTLGEMMPRLRRQWGQDRGGR